MTPSQDTGSNEEGGEEEGEGEEQTRAQEARRGRRVTKRRGEAMSAGWKDIFPPLPLQTAHG